MSPSASGCDVVQLEPEPSTETSTPWSAGFVVHVEAAWLDDPPGMRPTAMINMAAAKVAIVFMTSTPERTVRARQYITATAGVKSRQEGRLTTKFPLTPTFYWTPRRASTQYSEGESRNKTRNYGQLGRHSHTKNPSAALTRLLSATSRATCRCGATARSYFRQKPAITPPSDHCDFLRATTIIDLTAK